MEKMLQLGGETVPKLVRNIISQTIGYEVAQAYTWTGKKKKINYHWKSPKCQIQ